MELVNQRVCNASANVSSALQVGLFRGCYGPSIPTLFNIHKPGIRAIDDNRFYPNEVDEAKLMSIRLMGDGPAVIRGPMVAQYMQQLLHGVLG